MDLLGYINFKVNMIPTNLILRHIKFHQNDHMVPISWWETPNIISTIKSKLNLSQDQVEVRPLINDYIHDDTWRIFVLNSTHEPPSMDQLIFQ